MAAQGARQRVAEIYGKALDAIGGLQGALESGDFERVSEGVPAAGQAIDAVRDAMAAAAAEAIQEADKVIAQAEKADAEVAVEQSPAKKTLAAARRARGEAADALEGAKFGTVFAKTQSCAELSARAETEAYTTGAEDALNDGASILAMARQADAPVESPNAYRIALDAETAAKDALSAGQAKLAYQRSLEARRTAQEALDNRIDTAAKAVDDAREALASTYAPNDLRKAEALYNQARTAHKQHDFAKANSLAKQAVAVAATGESFAWRQRSTSLLAELEQTEVRLTEHNALDRAPECAIAFRSHAAKGRAAYVGSEWELAYAEAAAADQAANAAWQTMEDEVQLRLTTVRDLLKTMAEIADDAPEHVTIDTLTAQVDPVLDALALGDYNNSYILSGALLGTAETSLDAMERENREQAADRLSKRLAELRKDGAAEVLAAESEELKAYIGELRDDESAIGYATLMAQKLAWEGRLDTMPERSLEEAGPRLDQIAALFASARENDAARLYPSVCASSKAITT